MSNTLNSIHYCVVIETSSTISDSSIGLNSGIFRFTSDGYFPPSGAIYEDLTPVSGIFNTSLLSSDGISVSSQSINITMGGDFAFLASLDIQLINTNNLHKKMTSTNDLYLVGSEVKLYVSIDDVWYSRWNGSVKGYNFNDNDFTIQCEDKNTATNQVIKGVVYGRSYVTPVITTPDGTTAIIKDAPVNMFFPYTGSVVGYDQFSNGPTIYNDNFIEFFSGGTLKYKNLLSSEKRIDVRLNGGLEHYSEVNVGSFMKFDDDDNFYEISEINEILLDNESGGTPECYVTSFIIEEKPVILTTYDQFFGFQGSWANQNIIDGTAGLVELEGTAKVFVSIYPNSAYVDITGKELITSGGKYEAINGDGNTVFISGTNDDNKLNLTSNKQYEFIYPVDVKEWQYGSAEDSNTFANLIDSGKCFNLEQYGTTLNTDTWNNIDNNNIKSDNNYKITQYLLMTFDQDINDTIPFIGLNSISKGLYNWVNVAGTTDADFGLHLDSSEPGPTTPSRYDTYPLSDNYTSDAEGYARSIFPSWEVDIYRVCDAGVYGDVPYYLSTVVIPNVKKQLELSKFDTELYKNLKRIMIAETQSMTGTNLPYESFTVDNMFSTTNGVENYNLPFPEALASYVWPFGEVEFNAEPTFTLPPAVSANNKLLFRIRVAPNGSPVEADWFNGYIKNDITTTLIMDGREPAKFGIHSFGVYKTQPVDDTLKFKTTSTDTDLLTIPGIITELVPDADVSGISDRADWNVGLNITEETNKFSIITELCKQSFIGGYTNRKGDLIFKEFIERMDSAPDYTLSDQNFIDKSLGDFKTTELSNLYNDFTIKYHNINGTFKKSYEIHKVDQASFPAYDDFYYDWSAAIDTDGKGTSWNGPTQQLVIDSSETPTLLAMMLDDKYSSYKFKAFGGDFIEFTNPIRNAYLGDLHYFSVDLIPNTPYTPLSQVAILEVYYNKDTRGAKWSSEYVIGINSYADAKELWEIAHQSWLINKQILVAPSDRSELKYSIDLNSFYNQTNNDYTTEYAYEYLKMFLLWTTRQKLLVNFSLPITTDTIKLELLDRVDFSDLLITPEPGEVGKGIIRSLQLDTKKFQIKVGLIFEPRFMMPPPAPAPMNIIETGYNDINIIETGSNPNNIIEG